MAMKKWRIGPCVSIFGSARLKEDSYYYKMASEIAKKITEIGLESLQEAVRE
jgi:predicted Rossmann-fold nucleotide-binding protein